MQTINTMPTYNVQPAAQPIIPQTPQPRANTTHNIAQMPMVVAGTPIAPMSGLTVMPNEPFTVTVTLASALAIGSNMVNVQNGTMTLTDALLNGVIKGTAASLILNSASKSSITQITLTAAILAGAGYLIDTTMT